MKLSLDHYRKIAEMVCFLQKVERDLINTESIKLFLIMIVSLLLIQDFHYSFIFR